MCERALQLVPPDLADDVRDEFGLSKTTVRLRLVRPLTKARSRRSPRRPAAAAPSSDDDGPANRILSPEAMAELVEVFAMLDRWKRGEES